MTRLIYFIINSDKGIGRQFVVKILLLLFSILLINSAYAYTAKITKVTVKGSYHTVYFELLRNKWDKNFTRLPVVALINCRLSYGRDKSMGGGPFPVTGPRKIGKWVKKKIRVKVRSSLKDTAHHCRRKWWVTLQFLGSVKAKKKYNGPQGGRRVTAKRCRKKKLFWDKKYNQCLKLFNLCPKKFSYSSRLKRCYKRIPKLKNRNKCMWKNGKRTSYIWDPPYKQCLSSKKANCDPAGRQKVHYGTNEMEAYSSRLKKCYRQFFSL
mgnify:CR=1 FL=1